jgi:hypothetical protein
MTSLIEENERLHAALSEMRGRIAELEQLADTDTLTPLPNRRAFMRRLEAVVQYAARHNTPAAVLYIDLDGLKRINDDHGHHVGDAVLLHLARLLTESLRATDMVARIGGDWRSHYCDPRNHWPCDGARGRKRCWANRARRRGNVCQSASPITDIITILDTEISIQVKGNWLTRWDFERCDFIIGNVG